MEIKKVFLFDVDGVIAETPHEEAWRNAAINWGLINNDFEFKQFYAKNVAGIPGLKGAEAILEGLDYFGKNWIIDELERKEKAKEFREVKQSYLDDFLSEGKFRVFEDMSKIIFGAKEDKIPVAAVSSSENSRKILEKISLIDKFDSLTLGAIAHRIKSKSELYSFAFGKLCGKIGDYEILPYPIVFEDSVKCISELRKMDYFCVGISREGLSTKQELCLAGADLAYDENDLWERSYSDILKDINNMLEKRLLIG